MKDLRGSAATPVDVPPDDCIVVLAAVDRYPEWYPDVIREVGVLERGEHGFPSRARTTVHLGMGRLANDFHFEVTIDVRPAAVILARVPDDHSDEHRLEIHWRVTPGELEVELTARLDLPRLLPLGGAGDSVAQGFVKAAKGVLNPERAVSASE